MRIHRVGLALGLAVMIALALAGPAPATFPGSNGPIAYSEGEPGASFDVFLVNPDGSGATNLTNSAATDNEPAVSPDGQRVVFTSDRNGNDDIYLVNVDGSGLTALTTDPGNDFAPAWSPDGSELVFVSSRPGGGDLDLFVMNADGSGQTNLTATPEVEEWDPDWSPDGTRIAFGADAGTFTDLYVMPAEGGPATLVYSEGPSSWNPSWSPDGSRIAFDSLQQGARDIWVVDADGSDPVNVTANPADDYTPSWAPDGTRIAFATRRAGPSGIDIATMSPDGSDVSLVTGGALPSWGPVGPDPVTRLFGPERIATAVAISGDYVMSGAAGAALLARADLFPDALAGAPLAVARGGPLLLSASSALSAATATELQRVLPSGSTVYLLGGTAALSAQVEADVQALGYATTRLGGANRFATAVAIAEELGAPAPLYVADGGTFQAAEISGVAAAVNAGAVVLTSGTTLPPETQAYLSSRGGVTRFAIGPEAIAADPDATPVGGADAYEVSVNLATTAFGASPTRAALASGTVFADGLTGGPHAVVNGAPLLLTDPNALPGSVRTYLSDHAATIDGLFAYGGPAAIADGVVTDAQTAISTTP